MKNLYTITLGVKGGTFVSQVDADSVNEAFYLWMNNLFTKNVAEFSERELGEIKSNYDRDIDVPVGIEGRKNVWCADFNMNKHYLSINIVKTASN